MGELQSVAVGLLSALAVTSACASHVDDGFRVVVSRGCGSERQCEALAEHAHQRVRACEADGDRCDEQRYDAQFVDTQRAAWKTSHDLAARTDRIAALETEKTTCDARVTELTGQASSRRSVDARSDAPSCRLKA